MTISSITTTPSTKQLVSIIQADFNGETINAVDARDLHLFLEVKEHFTDWISRYLNEYGFVINSDFCRSTCLATNGRGMETYILTIDMAKEMSMISKTAKGKQARKYFIQCEKAIKTGMIPSANMPTATVELKACVEMAHIFGLEGNQALLSANAAVKNLHGIDCMDTLGITGLIAEDKKQYFTPSVLGKKIGLSAVKFNKALEAAGMQTANRDHKKRLVWQVTETGKQYCQLLDTQKKHKNGTPIHQIKWCEDVIDFFNKLVP